MSNEPLGVDLADLFHHERERRHVACAAIESQLFGSGAVTIRRHGVHSVLARRLSERFDAFISGPVDAKRRIEAHARGWYQRGWLPSTTPPSGTERFRAAPLPLAEATRLDEPQIGAPNVWPDAGFERDAVELTQQLHEAGLAVLQGLATATGLPPRAFDHRVEGAAHLLELASVSKAPAPALEPEPKLLTLVVQPASGETDGDEGASEDAEGAASADAQVRVFAGQTLEILMGGRVRASAIPQPEPPTARCTYSLQLLNLQLLFPFERFRTVHTRLEYGPPVLAQTYRTKTLVDLGLAPPDALTGLGMRRARRV